MSVARGRPQWLPDPDQGESTFVGDLLRSETVGGILVLGGAFLAMLWANLSWESYEALRGSMIGPLDIEHWASDGALALFFYIAGLELKRELLVGSLRRPADAAVPVVAAICGVAVPALIFLAVNRGTDNLGGWAVPAATDIAFALAILAVVGSSLPDQLRAFLLTLAVADDMLVIAVIAFFYTEQLDLPWMALSIAAFVAFALLQRLRIQTSLLYVPVALVAWVGTHESGVHATIAGVVMGLLTRVKPDDDETRSPSERLEHRLAPISAGVAVPLFALMSAGVELGGGIDLTDPVVLGVVLALVVGKPVGVLGGSWVLTRFTRAELNPGLTWRDLAGVGLVAGVGFTVSLLVSDLAFEGAAQERSKAAVLLGSLVAGLSAAIVLGRRNRVHQER